MADRLVTIATFACGPDRPCDAELARKKLISCGIETFLDENNPADIFDWPHGRIKLQVKACDAAEALEILQGQEISIEIDSPSLTERPLCPKCHSANIDCEKFSATLFYISVFFKFPVPFLKQRYRCTNCRHSWY